MSGPRHYGFFLFRNLHQDQAPSQPLEYILLYMFPNLGWLGVAENALTTRLWRPHQSPLMLFYDFMHVWTCEINFRKWLRLCFCLVRTRLDTRAFTSSSEGSAAKQMLLRTGSMTQLLSTRKTLLFQRKNISVHFLTRQYLFTWQVITALFVFLINDPKQNTRSLLMHVSDTAFYALSHGSIGFAPHGSFFNHFPIGQKSSTDNQKPCNLKLF